MLQIDDITDQVLENCNIADAQHAGLYSICGLALRLRDLYKWENRLDPWIENDPLSVHKKLHQIRVPALLKVYIMSHCLFCPATVKKLLCLAAASESIKLTVIDCALFPEEAASDNIQSAPTA